MLNFDLLHRKKLMDRIHIVILNIKLHLKLENEVKSVKKSRLNPSIISKFSVFSARFLFMYVNIRGIHMEKVKLSKNDLIHQ